MRFEKKTLKKPRKQKWTFSGQKLDFRSQEVDLMLIFLVISRTRLIVPN